MTIGRVATFAFAGIEAVPVEVQVQLAAGMPAFLVVGLPDKAVAESRERVRAALSGLGLSLPAKRVLVNLAPADIVKEGSHFDLPIALAVLAAMDVLPREEMAGYAALGELSLDGAINPVSGVLPAALGASARDLGLICPASQGGEAAWAGRVEVLAAPDLLALMNHFRGTQVLSPPEPPPPEAAAPHGPCLSEVKGQESAKRALEIAAAGGHNLLKLDTLDLYDACVVSRLAVPVSTTAPTVATLASAGAGALFGCYRCGRWMALDLDRAAKRLGMGQQAIAAVPCPGCGGTGDQLLICGVGWEAGPLTLPWVGTIAPLRVTLGASAQRVLEPMGLAHTTGEPMQPPYATRLPWWARLATAMRRG